MPVPLSDSDSVEEEEVATDFALARQKAGQALDHTRVALLGQTSGTRPMGGAWEPTRLCLSPPTLPHTCPQPGRIWRTLWRNRASACLLFGNTGLGRAA